MSEIILPFPHPGQQTVWSQKRRFNWLSAGRRWRKTTLVMSIAVQAAARGEAIIWGAPVFDQVRIGWTETKRAAIDVAAFNQSTMTATFPSGGSIIYRSLDNPDNARGHTADGVVMDECADIQSAAWSDVLRPMLIDTNGWAWGIGTPKGRNWFWQQYTGASDRADSASWQAPTLGVEVTAKGLIRRPHPLENPSIPFDEMVQLWHTTPEMTFRQEILGEFLESSGGVFRRVLESCTATAQDKAQERHQYVMGVDWGRLEDFTVLSVIDVTSKQQVAFDRFNTIEYQTQLGRLKALYERFKPSQIIAEQNSVGIPLIEQMQRDNLPVQPFLTTNATKASAIDALALAFERGDLQILPDPVQTAELQAYEAERLPSGLMRYGAPSGQHDDCVMSLALAYQGCLNSGPLLLWGGSDYDD